VRENRVCVCVCERERERDVLAAGGRLQKELGGRDDVFIPPLFLRLGALAHWNRRKAIFFHVLYIFLNYICR